MLLRGCSRVLTSHVGILLMIASGVLNTYLVLELVMALLDGQDIKQFIC